jgi:Chromatin-associated proteins containing the HMG domain
MIKIEDDNSINILDLIDNDDDDSLFGSTRKISKQIGTKKTSSVEGKTSKRKRKPKPADMPRRPLSAYNIFFQEQRALIIGTKPPSLENRPKVTTASPNFERKKRAHRRTHGKISFSDLAKAIGKKWNELSEDGRSKYVESAAKEKARYQEELKIYKRKREESEVKNQVHRAKRTSLQHQEVQLSAPPKRFYSSQETTYPPPSKKSRGHVPLFRYQIDVSSSRDDRFCDVESHLIAKCETFDVEEHDIRESRDESLDDIQPLPIGYDPSYHQDDFISTHEMAKLVAPLLKGNKTGHSSTQGRNYRSDDSSVRNFYTSPMDSRNFNFLPTNYTRL